MFINTYRKESGIGNFTPNDFESLKLPVKIAGNVKNFDIEDYIAKPIYKRRLSRFVQLGVATASLCHDEQDYPDKTRVGVCIGSGTTDLMEIGKAYELLKQGKIRNIQPVFVTKILSNMINGYVSMEYGFQGPSICPVTACATGVHAIGEAYRAIQYGDADVIICGGSESCLDPISLAGFSRIKALCIDRNDEPEKASRPFDRKRSGFVMSEGCGLLQIEEWESANARGAEILAEIVGYGKSSDAFHITSPANDGNGATRASMNAVMDAKIDANEISYINAHATSTPTGDEIEYQAMLKLFTSSGHYINSTKGNIGHTIGAAGAIESIATILSLKHGVIPSTLNCDDPIDQDNKLTIVRERTSVDMEYAMCNGFGFGGTNGSLIFKRV